MKFENMDSRVRRAIAKLYGDRYLEYGRRYKRNKKIAILLTILISIAAITVYILGPFGKTGPIEGRYLGRDDTDGINRTFNIRAVSSKGYTEELKLVVENRRYSAPELEELYTPFKEALKKAIVPQGESLDAVSSDMNLPSRLNGYPFTIIWHSDDHKVLSDKGIIKEDGIVTLIADVECDDFSKELMIPVSVCHKAKSDEELFWEKVNEEIDRLSMSTKSESYQILPTKVMGQTVSYSKGKDPTVPCVIIFGLIAAVLINAAKDEELIRKAAKRDEQLKRDYPKFINKIVLYYGAGLPIKNIWLKMCRNYEQERKSKATTKRVVYEEMLRCEKKMRDGYTEETAYEAFADSVGITEYTQLINILIQAVRTGGTDIRHVLGERRSAAFEEQKKNARILGEKAGTKLLLPMFMMLMVVFIIVLVPAFLSF